MRIISITHNEEKNLGIWYHWYKERFPNAIEFIIYDNLSSDYTIQLAQELGIRIVSFDTNNTFDDRYHREFKNKDIRNGWKIFGDIDELVDINEEIVKKEEELGTNIFRFSGWDYYEGKYKLRNSRMDKSICWNSNEILPNFDYGAHNCKPEQLTSKPVKWSSKEYELRHNKYHSLEEFVERTLFYANRVESWNKSVGHAKEYFQTKEELINQYNKNKEKAIKIL